MPPEEVTAAERKRRRTERGTRCSMETFCSGSLSFGERSGLSGCGERLEAAAQVLPRLPIGLPDRKPRASGSHNAYKKFAEDIHADHSAQDKSLIYDSSSSIIVLTREHVRERNPF